MNDNARAVKPSLASALARIEVLERELADLREAVGNEGATDLADVPSQARPAVRALRNWIGDDRHAVHVRGLVTRETGRLIEALTSPDLTNQGVPFSDAELRRRVDQFREASTTVASLYAEAGYWGAPDRDHAWTRSLQRIANAVEGGNGLVVWLNLRLLPALMIEYAGGIAAVANEQYESLNALLTQPLVIQPGKSMSLVEGVVPSSVMEPEVAKRLEGFESRRTPANDWLHTNLRPILRPIAPDDYSYDDAFDRFEYLLGAIYAHRSERQWAPIGRFSWKDAHRPMNGLVETISAEVEAQGKNWPPFRAGLFGEDIEDARSTLAWYNAWVGRASRFLL